MQNLLFKHCVIKVYYSIQISKNKYYTNLKILLNKLAHKRNQTLFFPHNHQPDNIALMKLESLKTTIRTNVRKQALD